MNNNFENKLYKGFVVPGVIAEIFLLINMFLPEDLGIFGLPLFSHSIGGPTGVAVGMTILPAQLLLYIFLLVAAVYAVVLPLSYRAKSLKFIPRAHRFLLFCDLSFIILTLVFTFCVAISIGYGLLNWLVVIPMLLLMYGVCYFFIHWTREVYRHREIRFWSKTTLLGISFSLLIIFGSLALCWALLFMLF